MFQEIPEIHVKLVNPNAVMPAKAGPNECGYDVVAAVEPVIQDTYIEYDIGIQVEPPAGFYFILVPRSSVTKYDLVFAQGVGIIDPTYRGNLKMRFKRIKTAVGSKIYDVGDKIGQLVLMPYFSAPIVQKETLTDTARGAGGFGSTGK